MEPRLVPHGGRPDRLGATVTDHGVNFAVYSETAEKVWVCLFDEADRELHRFELDGRDGAVHHGLVAGIGAGARYGLRADGPYDPAQGFWFDPQKLLVDPYARQIDRMFELSPKLTLPREAAEDTAALVPKGMVVAGSGKPAQPRRKQPGLIYELNVRGYTMQHAHVPEKLRGTLEGLTQSRVLAHLQEIGADTVELMPVNAFIDDLHLPRLGLRNAWGYNPMSYFALDPRLAPNGLDDLRLLTDCYRKQGISVVMDVVYNHTGESDVTGPVLSFRGLDARTYYRHVPVDGRMELVNDAGTGNVLQCDHPAVQRLVLESLRYFVEEGGVSGFRFDLAPILGRDPGFNPEAKMLTLIKADPVLGKCLLIAEPWDPGPGGYQLGRFGKEFREWNDTFRDEVRNFWRGEHGRIGALAGKLAGSSEIFDFAGRRPSHGVNFLAAHDGFTLRDLVSYSHKHNEANGEQNRDGHSHNASWNCGVEGDAGEPAIIAARKRDVRALLATLFLARGTPMLQQGDELWRTQQGNNNAYPQDNAITWLDWDNADQDLVRFVAELNRFRRSHPAVTNDQFLTGQERNGTRDVVWLHPDGREMTQGDWNEGGASVLGMWLATPEDEVLLWFNRWIDPVGAQIPAGNWALGLASDKAGEIILSERRLLIPARSVVALVRKDSSR